MGTILLALAIGSGCWLVGVIAKRWNESTAGSNLEVLYGPDGVRRDLPADPKTGGNVHQPIAGNASIRE